MNEYAVISVFLFLTIQIAAMYWQWKYHQIWKRNIAQLRKDIDDFERGYFGE